MSQVGLRRSLRISSEGLSLPVELHRGVRSDAAGAVPRGGGDWQRRIRRADLYASRMRHVTAGDAFGLMRALQQTFYAEVIIEHGPVNARSGAARLPTA